MNRNWATFGLLNQNYSMKKLYAFVVLLALTLPAVAQYTTTTLVTGMQYPVAFDIAPDGRFFCTQKGGNSNPAVNAKIKVYDASGAFLADFYDLTDSTDADFERGLLGITLDPDFTNNHYVYAYYVHLYNNDERLRVVRLTENNNTGSNPTLVFDLDVSESIAGNHVGGNVHFRPSEPDKLYITIGDLAYQQTNTSLNYAQQLTLPFGKTLRVNTTGTLPNNIPTTNPFYDDGVYNTGNCDYIWSYGHRNPFDFCFSPVTDSMYSSENGLNTWDEVNQIHRGANYGWNTCEGNFLNSSTSSPCTGPNFIAPIDVWGSPLPAVTGIVYYSGQVMPEFDNHLLVADNDYGRVYDLTLGNAPAYDMITTAHTQWMDLTTTGGLTTLKEGTDGCVYAMKGGYTTNGQIYRVCPTGLYVENQKQDFSISDPSPNPVSDRADLRYNISQTQDVLLSLYDLMGRKVMTLAQGQQEPGSHLVGIDVNAMGLASGSYVAVLEVGGAKKAVKLVVAH